MLSVHPLRPGAAERHAAWCQRLRQRRDEFATSRRAVGIARQVFWLQPEFELAVVRTDADDPLDALQRLRDSSNRFDRWYRKCELDVHGSPLVEAGEPPELLSDHRVADIDDHDLFVAWALPITPGRSNELRHDVRAGDGAERARRWRVKRMAIWMQHVDGRVEGPRDAGRDVAVIELAGDIPRMVRVLTSDSSPEVVQQRSLLNDVFGLDVERRGVPLPVPAFAWSATPAHSSAT